MKWFALAFIAIFFIGIYWGAVKYRKESENDKYDPEYLPPKIKDLQSLPTSTAEAEARREAEESCIFSSQIKKAKVASDKYNGTLLEILGEVYEKDREIAEEVINMMNGHEYAAVLWLTSDHQILKMAPLAAIQSNRDEVLALMRSGTEAFYPFWEN